MVEVAKKLLMVGDNIDKVQMVTDLPLDTIKKLAREFNK